MDAWRYGIYLLVFTFDISLVRYRCEHSKINSISPRDHVLFSIYLTFAHKRTWLKIANTYLVKCIPELGWLHYQNPRQGVAFWGTRQLPALLLWSGLLPWFLTQQLWNTNNIQANLVSVTFPLRWYNFSAVFSFNTTYNFQELWDKKNKSMPKDLVISYHALFCQAMSRHIIYHSMWFKSCNHVNYVMLCHIKSNNKLSSHFISLHIKCKCHVMSCHGIS